MHTTHPLYVLMALALVGCAPTRPDPPEGAAPPISGPVCFDARHFRDIEVVGDHELVVHQGAHRSFRVVLRDSCPELEKARSLGFSSGPSRIVGRGPDGLPLYAEPLWPSGRICADGFSRVVAYPPFHQFDRPLVGCRIGHIARTEPSDLPQ